jgi:hypothetical protein
LRLTKKHIGKTKKDEKISCNVVKDKKKKIQENFEKKTAEDRANNELEKLVAYQMRLAKSNNKEEKIRTVMDENYSVAKRSITFIYYIIVSKKLP